MDLLFAGVGLALVTWLSYEAYREWQKGSQEARRAFVETLVAAAQQMFDALPGELRYQWVAERLAARFPGLDQDEAEALIEAAVYRLKQRLTERGERGDAGPYIWRKN